MRFMLKFYTKISCPVYYQVNEKLSSIPIQRNINIKFYIEKLEERYHFDTK